MLLKMVKIAAVSLIMVAALLYFINTMPKRLISAFIEEYYTVDKGDHQAQEYAQELLSYYKEKEYKVLRLLLTEKALKKMDNENSIVERSRYILPPKGSNYRETNPYELGVSNIKISSKEKEGDIIFYDVTFNLEQLHYEYEKFQNYVIGQKTIKKRFYLSKEDGKWKINENNNFEVFDKELKAQ